MNLQQTAKKSLSIVTLAIAAIIAGFLFTSGTNHRQYSPGNIVKEGHDDEENDPGAAGMAQYFFTARRNITTNAMDYPSMLAADIADRAMSRAQNTHAPSSSRIFTWNSVGPTNIGGRTRAFLIDNNDPTHQTLFAGGVSGGIWKSTNGGATWDNGGEYGISYSLNDTLENINVCCIAQDINGAIYIGTGEGFDVLGYNTGQGFSTGILGGGVFKSIDDGKTWRLLPKTVPITTTSNNSVVWAYVNRLAIRPDSFKVIYAATNQGVYISRDSGATWRNVYNPTHTRLTGNSLDLKISGDGSVLVACMGGDGYYCYPKTNDSIFTQIKVSGAGHLPDLGERIEFAIAPSDPNRVYACYLETDQVFGAGATTSGIFMTKTAQTNGGYWYEIGPGGSSSFDPYSPGGAPDQADYDNTLGVPPNNEDELFCGGTTLWVWTQTNSADTTGSWAKISHYQPYETGDSLWIHADEHAIVFDQNNPTTVYFGCDGGVFKCTNMSINPSNVSSSIKSLFIQPINRNYNVTQYYTICYSPQVDPSNMLGMGGGTQDNGSPCLLGTGYYQYDAIDVTGGDGAGCVVSSLNPNIGYFCSDNGALLKTADISTLATPATAYTQIYGNCLGADIDSIYNKASASGEVCFVMPVALYENAYDLLNIDSLKYIAPKNMSKGDTIYPQDANGPTSYPYKLPKALAVGDTLTVPDRVVSRLAVGFSPNYGIWMTGQGASNGNVIWMPIAGPLSTPTAYTGTSPVHCLTWTPDGNTLFVGCEDGTFFRFSNINSIIANNYCSGALWYKVGTSVNTGNQVVSTSLTTQLGAGSRDILSIAVDPENANNVLVTIGGYGSTAYVYYSSNALAASPTFTSVQGNLPDMPVYSSILDIRDSNGSWSTNSAMLATEHGIYTTTNIAAGTVSWIKNNKGMANCLCLAIGQQTLPPWRCNNSGIIYLGTHGRGIWTSNTNYQPTAVQNITGSSTAALNDLLIYPNPMTSEGSIEYNLASADNVIISIYNMQGKEVKTVTMGTQSPGTHLVTFESTDLPAGAYFAALTGDNFRKVSKFIVVK